MIGGDDDDDIYFELTNIERILGSMVIGLGVFHCYRCGLFIGFMVTRKT